MHSHLTKFRDPGLSIDEPTPDVRIWAVACDHFENQRYPEALRATLEHISPPAFAEAGNGPGPFRLSATHGSASVEITIEDDRFSIHAPFLKLGDQNRVPLMRRVAEVNFQSLILSSIALQDDQLYFEYDTVVDLCQPSKIMTVLHEICVYADRYDDEFISKYNATFYREPEIADLSAAEQLTVWDYLGEVAAEYRRYIEFFERKHAERLEWELITTTMLQVANVPTIHGTLRWTLEDQIARMYDSEIDPPVRIESGRRFVDELCARIGSKDFAPEIYHAKSFLSTKQVGTLAQLQQDAANSRENIYGPIISGNAYVAAFVLRHFLCRLLYQYSLQAEHREAITQALEETGGAPTGDALVTLKALYDQLLEGILATDTQKGKKRGFFSRFFG